MSESSKRARVIIVGGSVGGLSCASSLLREGCDILVLEKARKITPAGAGLGLDPKTCAILTQEFGLADKLEALSRPLPVEECRWVNCAVPIERRTAVSLAFNDKHNHRCLHWSDLHRMLLESLPEGCVRYAHKVIGYKQSDDGVTASVERTDGLAVAEPLTFTADFLVAADGSKSTIRQLMLPVDQQRYTGLIAWRGVMDGGKHPEVVKRLKADFRNLERAITYDMSPGRGEIVVYMLPGDRINWIWLRDAPEPDLAGHSVTMQPSQEDIAALYADVEAAWTASFAELVKATEQPFLNVIYDKEPVQSWTDGCVALLGEAAHPTTSFASRSTNMSIQDCSTLGQCIREHKDDPVQALSEYEKRRLPQTSHEVLFSRYVGELRNSRLTDPSLCWPVQPDSLKAMLLIANIKDKEYKAKLEKELKKAVHCEE